MGTVVSWYLWLRLEHRRGILLEESVGREDVIAEAKSPDAQLRLRLQSIVRILCMSNRAGILSRLSGGNHQQFALGFSFWPRKAYRAIAICL